MISSLLSKFEFTNRRALFLSAQKAAIYHWHKGEVGSSYLFDVNQESQKYFERYLNETQKYPVSILVDVFEEEYRRETIPHVFGPDRSALIERKQARLFRDTPYTHTKVQGREETGRRDDRIFLSAISNPDVIQPWVALLDKYKVPLHGIISLPLFSESLLASIPNPSKNMLIVSLQSISGLRQTFFQDGEFRISRLVQMPRFGTTSYVPYINDEVEKIRRYLNSLRLLHTDEPLDIYFLLAGDLLREIKLEDGESDLAKYYMLDLNDMLADAGSEQKLTTPFSDQYFIHEFLKRKPANHYASGKETRYFSMRRMRYSMLAASVLLILAGSIWSSLNFVQGLISMQSSIAAVNKTQFYKTRYEIAKENFLKTAVEPADIKIAVDLAETLNEYKSSPFEMIRFISLGLNRFPVVHLDDINWTASTDPNSSVGKSNAKVSGQGVMGVSNVSYAETGFRYYQIAVINAHLDPFEGDFREAISTIKEFAETLRGGKSVHDISIVTLPLDASSTASLQGNTKIVKNKADFSIRIILGIGHET